MRHKITIRKVRDDQITSLIPIVILLRRSSNIDRRVVSESPNLDASTASTIHCGNGSELKLLNFASLRKRKQDDGDICVQDPHVLQPELGSLKCRIVLLHIRREESAIDNTRQLWSVVHIQHIFRRDQVKHMSIKWASRNEDVVEKHESIL
jgi:hypothetical protein